MPREDGALAPLHHAPFRFLAAGRVITMFGNAMAPIALAFAVLDITGSVRDLGLVVGARSLMNVVFVLFGWVVADRLPRHLVMVASSILAALTQGTVAVLVLTGDATIPVLIGLSAMNGVVSSFSFPAAAALLPQTVPAQIHQQANAINRMGVNAATIFGASLGGVLVAAAGSAAALAVDAATFALAAIAFALVRVPGVRDRAAPHDSLFVELRDGWREFASRTWVWVVVLGFMFLSASYAGAFGVLGPVVADDTFGRQGLGFVLAASTAGFVAGGV